MTDRVHIKPTRPAGPGLWFELIGDDERTGGVGGWEALARPRRTSAVEWVGTPAIALGLPLLVSGIDKGVGGRRNARRIIVNRTDLSIEPALRRLETWGRKVKKQDTPAVLRVRGPVRAPETARWVIEDIEWGAQIRHPEGHRVQQELVLRLLEFVEADVLRSPAAAARNRKNHR